MDDPETGVSGAHPVQAGHVSFVIGQALRAIRKRCDATLDDVAEIAQRVGLEWDKTTVLALEQGRKRLEVDELILLPPILYYLDDDVGLFGLLPEGDEPVPVRTSPSGKGHTLSARAVRELLSGMPYSACAAPRLDVYTAAPGPLEVQVADEAGLPPLVVSALAHTAWGHSARAERDHRARGVDSSALGRRRQTLRGHAARAVMVELRALVADWDQGRGDVKDPRGAH